MNLRCAEADELLAPYALNALETQDRIALLEHLAECRRHDEDLLRHQETAALLAGPWEDVPPPALRDATLAAFRRERSGGTLAAPLPLAAPAQRSVSIRRWPYAVAASLVLLLIGLAAWNFSLRDDGLDGVQVHTARKDGHSLRLVFLPEEQVTLLVTDLPPAPSGHVYQAWRISDTATQSIGVVPDQGTHASRLDLSGAKSVALTIEPLPGSSSPTTEPVIVASLR